MVKHQPFRGGPGHRLGWYAGWYEAREFLHRRRRREPPRLPAERDTDVLDYVDGVWAYVEGAARDVECQRAKAPAPTSSLAGDYAGAKDPSDSNGKG